MQFAGGYMSRIVLVDDNPTTLKRWESLLSPLGHEVISFSGAEPALQVLKVHPTSLVVLDLAMPIHTGYDLMQTLKSEDVTCPVLVVSGKNNQEDIKRAMTLGAVDYVLKPFDDEIFLAKVDHILQTQQQLEDNKSPFAETVYSQSSQFLVTLPSLTISEMGFKFQTSIPLKKGIFLNFNAACFAEMGIKDNRFRVTSIIENHSAAENKYTVFVSFVGLSLAQLKEVRMWVRQNQMRTRKAV